MEDELYEIYKDKGITKIVGIESRGFVLASALAIRLGAGVVLCRKPANFRPKQSRRATRKNTAATLSRFTKTPLHQMTWCFFTTTYWQPEEQ